MTLPSWERLRQAAEDEHDWVRWFAPANNYRGLKWNYSQELWTKTEDRR